MVLLFLHPGGYSRIGLCIYYSKNKYEGNRNPIFLRNLALQFYKTSLFMSVNNKSTKVKHTSIEGVTVQGARVHNLKNVDVFIPRDSLTVITGL